MINKSRLTFVTLVLLLSLAACASAAAPSNFSIQGDELEYDLESGEGTARGHVVLIQEDGQATGAFARFNSKTKTGYLEGNVVADKEDAHISCDKFIMHSEDFMSAVGNATLVKEGKTLTSEQVDYYKARDYMETVGGWARLTDVDGSVMTAEKITYDIKTGSAEATGGVNIDSEARKLTASADKAVYQTGSGGEVILLGNATAVQDGNSVAGSRLKLTNNKFAIADGGTKMVYIPKDKKATPAEDGAADANAAADGSSAETGEAAESKEDKLNETEKTVDKTDEPSLRKRPRKHQAAEDGGLEQ